jgi:hypothetical protein
VVSIDEELKVARQAKAAIATLSTTAREAEKIDKAEGVIEDWIKHLETQR